MLHHQFLIIVTLISIVTGQCPWSTIDYPDLIADCTCAFNTVQRISIRCNPVNMSQLLNVLHNSSVSRMTIETLSISNSTLAKISRSTFGELNIRKLELFNIGLREIDVDAFDGIASNLEKLILRDNKLTAVPTVALRALSSLRLIDLSSNSIRTLPADSFSGDLVTVMLADNQLDEISDKSLKLLSNLKNLNLKGCSLNAIPAAIEPLEKLAFLDLSQNEIVNIEPGNFRRLNNLEALSLDRNRIERLSGDTFIGANDSLSSLSMLNNRLTEFPSDAIASLSELRVLDLGFNSIESIPEDAFRRNNLLALLALDGNPLVTLSEMTFTHLNTTLRGLSIGGKSLACDCQLSWIVHWQERHQLKVTSRERNPQFCGSPDHLRNQIFGDLSIADLCSTGRLATMPPPIPSSSPPPSSTQRPIPTKALRRLPGDGEQALSPSTTAGDWSSSVSSTNGKRPTNSKRNQVKNVTAYRRDSAVIVEWEPSSESTGYQIYYRYFGAKEFKRTSTLPTSVRRYVLHHIAYGECLIICVQPSTSVKADWSMTVDDQTSSTCREIRPEKHRIADLDKIVIGATATVCLLVILVVIIFTCCYQRDKRKSSLPPSMATVATTLSAQNAIITKGTGLDEWETLSMYSSRSIPRARMYHVDHCTLNGSVHNLSYHAEDNRSHLSHYSNGGGFKNRPITDLQSQRSFPNLVTAYPPVHHGDKSALESNGSRKKSKNFNRLNSTSSLHSLTEYDSDQWQQKFNGNNNNNNNNNVQHSNNNNWQDNQVDVFIGKNHSKYLERR